LISTGPSYIVQGKGMEREEWRGMAKEEKRVKFAEIAV
jgi:hypothetical protein